MTLQRPPLRVGTAERSAATRALDEHLAAGRLDAEEYGERFAHASAASTAPQLAALFADLPAPHPPLAGLAVASPETRWPPPRPVLPPVHRVTEGGRLGLAVALAVLLPVLLLVLTAVTDDTGYLLLLPVLAVLPVLLGRGGRGGRRR